MIGLVLIAIGSGGIKPCVAAFGGDQFKLPEQAKQIATYFSLFYFSINAGSMISTFVTPILRSDVHCFDEQDCYSLAFGVPAILMLTSIAIFVLGRSLYVSRPPQGNMVVKMFRCIRNARVMKKKEKGQKKREHWLDYAEETDGKQMVTDIKALLNVLVLYIPLPIFWTLFDQQGSRWTFQATRMDGEITESFSLKPDQMQVVNPLLILVFIPLYDAVFYPLLSKIGVRRPLQKLTLGGILAGVAFIISAILELQLEKTYPVIPGVGEAQLRIYNGLPCTATVTFQQAEHTLQSMEMWEDLHLNSDTGHYPYTIRAPECAQRLPEGTFKLTSEMAHSYFIRESGVVEYVDSADKSSSGFPIMRVLSNIPTTSVIQFRDKDQVVQHEMSSAVAEITPIELLPSTYEILIDEKVLGAPLKIKLGGVHTVIISNTVS